jgi:hypothetical protein
MLASERPRATERTQTAAISNKSICKLTTRGSERMCAAARTLIKAIMTSRAHIGMLLSARPNKCTKYQISINRRRRTLIRSISNQNWRRPVSSFRPFYVVREAQFSERKLDMVAREEKASTLVVAN